MKFGRDLIERELGLLNEYFDWPDGGGRDVINRIIEVVKNFFEKIEKAGLEPVEVMETIRLQKGLQFGQYQGVDGGLRKAGVDTPFNGGFGGMVYHNLFYQFGCQAQNDDSASALIPVLCVVRAMRKDALARLYVEAVISAVEIVCYDFDGNNAKQERFIHRAFKYLLR